MTDTDVRRYCTLTDKSLHEIYIPTEAVSFKMYIVQMKITLQPGKQIMQNGKKKYTHEPGWAEYVDNLYDTSREIRHVD